MIRRFAFSGKDVVDDVRTSHDFDGELLDIFASNEGPVVHKWHHYIPIYDRYFSPFRGTNFRFLEIGVAEGGSLQLWRKYFGQSATIFGIDIDEDCARFDGASAQVRIGSQDDPDFLNRVVDEMGGVDVVLDDGSHMMPHIETSLRTLFPRMSANGVYMIEDLHTSYWSDWGGGYSAEANFFNTLRGLIDSMHHWYHDKSSELDEIGVQLGGLHIHDSVAVLEKGRGVRPTHSRIGKAK